MLDLTDVSENSGLLVPNGSYTVVLDTAEIKATKSGTGEYINCKFKVVGGEQDGKVLFNMFNIKNDNPKATAIGLGQLKTFLKCAGVTDFKIQDVNDLVGLKATAVVKTRTDEYGEKSVISYFKPAQVDPNEETAAAGGSTPF